MKGHKKFPAQSKGGKAILKKKGRGYFSELVKKRWKKWRENKTRKKAK